MSRNKCLSIMAGGGLLFMAFISPAQAVIAVSYSPYYGVAVNYADRGHRQKYQRASSGYRINPGYAYRQASPRSYYRSPRDHFYFNSRNYRRDNKRNFRSIYNRNDSGRRCD